MRGAAGPGDDHAEPAVRGLSRKLRGRVRRAMRGEDMRFVRHAEFIERFDRVAHRFPIRFAAHDDGHERGGRF